MAETITDPIVRVPVPLLAPLLDAAGTVLKTLPADEVPHAVRSLAAFDRRGLGSGAARAQLQRALEHDDAFRRAAVDAFGELPEVASVVATWERDRPLACVEEAAARDDLPLLASALYAARPEGWAFGLGAACGMFVGRRRDAADAEDHRALHLRAQNAEEARRRAEESHAALGSQVEELRRTLRDERSSRRSREDDAVRRADAAAMRARELEEELAAAREEATRRTRAGERATGQAAELDGALRASRKELLELRRELSAARHELARAPAPGSGLRQADLQALVDAAALARRLADGLGGVAEQARGAESPRRPTPSEPASRPPDPSAASRPAGARPNRARIPIPPGLAVDAPAAVQTMLATPGIVVVVDGYNVSMQAWPDLPVSEQRVRLVDLLAELHSRFRCVVVVVFDGAEVVSSTTPRRPGVRVLFSAPGEEADAVVVREVERLPAQVGALAVSSDHWVRDHAEAAGARAVPAPALLRVLRS